MALRFIDGFNHYATSDLTRKYTLVSGTSAQALISANGRLSTNALQITNANGVAVYVQKTLDAQATWIIGFAIKLSASSITNPPVILINLLDAGTTQCDLRLNGDFTLQVTRNATAVTGGLSNQALKIGIWQYVEFKVTIADSISANSCKVRVDGIDWITVTTGQDLKATANATANAIRIGNSSGVNLNGVSIYFNDYYICDGTGSINNDFLGDIKVETLYPDGAGNYSQFTCSTGSTHYTLVNNSTPNDDTDYVSSSTVNQIDTYTFGNLATSAGTILGAQTNMCARKDDAGTRTIAPFIRESSVDYVGTSVNLATSYYFLNQIYETDPAGGSFTVTSINAIECGIKLVA